MTKHNTFLRMTLEPKDVCCMSKKLTIWVIWQTQETGFKESTGRCESVPPFSVEIHSG